MLSRDFDVPKGAQHHQCIARQVRCEKLQQAKGRSIRPVQVVEDDQDRGALGRAFPERRNRIEQPETRLCSIGDWRWQLDIRDSPGHLGPQFDHCGRIEVDQGTQCVIVDGPDVLSKDLKPRPIGRRTRFFVATSPEHQNVARFSAECDLLCGARLADARFPRQHDNAPPPGERMIERLFQNGELGPPSDEERGGVDTPGLHPLLSQSAPR